MGCSSFNVPQFVWQEPWRPQRGRLKTCRRRSRLRRKHPSVHSVGKAHRQLEGNGRPHPTVACSCYRCGGAHSADSCRFKELTCNFFKKREHIAKVCRKKAKQQTARAAPQPMNSTNFEDPIEYGLYHTSSAGIKPIHRHQPSVYCDGSRHGSRTVPHK